jgi:large subunit GTPase 1
LHAADLGDGADWNRINLRSITEGSNLDDFLATAELAGTEFIAARLNMTFVPPASKLGVLTAEEKDALEKKHVELKSCLRIPRRFVPNILNSVGLWI